MVYILNELILDDFIRGDGFLDLRIRGSVEEVNNTIEKLYGPYKMIEKVANFQEFEFGDVSVKYRLNSCLSVKVLSSDKKKLDKLEWLIWEI